MAAEGVSIVERNDPPAVERLLRSLPDWFGIDSAVQSYVADAAVKHSLLAVGPGPDEVVGVLLGSRHFPETAEIHLLAVDPAHHGRGVGAALVAHYESSVRSDGVRLLEVKTLGPSRPDEHYARTLAFYRAQGFLPLEEIHGHWAGNPCLVLVKPLG